MSLLWIKASYEDHTCDVLHSMGFEHDPYISGQHDLHLGNGFKVNVNSHENLHGVHLHNPEVSDKVSKAAFAGQLPSFQTDYSNFERPHAAQAANAGWAAIGKTENTEDLPDIVNHMLTHPRIRQSMEGTQALMHTSDPEVMDRIARDHVQHHLTYGPGAQVVKAETRSAKYGHGAEYGSPDYRTEDPESYR